jgi:aspartyl-tRNA(Asn)/glutamyl-tRNA(Gln) amidotransferase subunit C
VAIGPDEVRRIADLANLDLDRSTESLSAELGAILDYVAMLDELDVTDVPPTSFGAAQEQRLRDDEIRPGPGAGRAIGNAPDGAAGYFRVPRVVDP